MANQPSAVDPRDRTVLRLACGDGEYVPSGAVAETRDSTLRPRRRPRDPRAQHQGSPWGHDSLRKTLERFNLPYRKADSQALVDAVPTWGPYPEVPEALRALASRYPDWR